MPHLPHLTGHCSVHQPTLLEFFEIRGSDHMPSKEEKGVMRFWEGAAKRGDHRTTTRAQFSWFVMWDVCISVDTHVCMYNQGCMFLWVPTGSSVINCVSVSVSVLVPHFNCVSVSECVSSY